MPSRESKADPGLLGQPFPQSADEAQKTLETLFAHLATTGDAELAKQIALSIEKIWRLPGGDTVNLLMDRAGQASVTTNYPLALKLLDAAVDLSPDYAEAWARRAFVHYLSGDPNAALADLRRTLALEPNHFKALDGLGKILNELGEKKAALKAYQQLLAVDPNFAGAQDAADELTKTVEGQGI